MSTSIDRRTLVKGAAWSVPAAAVLGTAPALAASPRPCVEVVVSKRVDRRGPDFVDIMPVGSSVFPEGLVATIHFNGRRVQKVQLGGLASYTYNVPRNQYRRNVTVNWYLDGCLCGCTRLSFPCGG